MEMYPVERTDERNAADAPEDLALLSSLLIGEEGKHQDFSSNRREYRAQMRHRAAEQLRLMELRAQSEAEAAADQAEVEAAAAHAEADAATVRLVAGRALQATGSTRSMAAPIDLASEEEVEHVRRSSLRDAAQHARRAAAERLEAARRAEAAALADSIARREEREIAEAQASAMRQAAHDAESDARSRQRKATLDESLASDRVSHVSGPRMVVEDRHAARESSLVGHRGSDGYYQPKPLSSRERLAEIAREKHALIDAAKVRLPVEHKEAVEAATGRDRPRYRGIIPSIPYAEFRRTNGAEPPFPAAEIVGKPPVSPVGGVEFASRSGSEPVVPITPDPVSIPAVVVTDTYRQDGNGKVGSSGTSETSSLARAQMPWSVAAENEDLQNVSRSKLGSQRSELQPTAVSEAGQVPPVEAVGPAWLYPNRQTPRSEEVRETSHAGRPVYTPAPALRRTGELNDPASELPVQALVKEGRDAVRESATARPEVQDASRWLALKEFLGGTDRDQNNERRPGRDERRTPPFLLVYSLAGGVGKTSLVAALGRALSSFGERVLLADTASHGPLPFYFGARTLRASGVRTFLPPNGSSAAPIQIVNYDRHNRKEDPATRDGEADNGIFEDLIGTGQRVNRVVMDLSVCDEWIAGRLAPVNPTVLIPLLADMNSIVSLKALERAITGMRNADGNALQPIYLLNQFDASLPLHADVRMFLKQQLGDRLLPLEIRRANSVSEGLAEGMTVFDYAPESGIAMDYLAVANWIQSVSASTAMDASSLRWNEG